MRYSFMVKMELWFPSDKQEVVEQFIDYDFGSFFADFGGYLGLILGYSMFTFYEWPANFLTARKAGLKRSLTLFGHVVVLLLLGWLVDRYVPIISKAFKTLLHEGCGAPTRSWAQIRSELPSGW